MKKLLVMLLALCCLSLLFAACGSSGNAVTVHTKAMSFEQSSVTLKKGQNLRLVNDASDTHMISLGTWQNNTAKPEQEPGAPSVQNEPLSGNSTLTIGPWNAPGTYHLYCTIHQNMKLTVIVQ